MTSVVHNVSQIDFPLVLPPGLARVALLIRDGLSKDTDLGKSIDLCVLPHCGQFRICPRTRFFHTTALGAALPRCGRPRASVSGAWL